jgi:hypothetical protein
LLHKPDIDLHNGKPPASSYTPSLEQLEKQKEYLLQKNDHKYASIDIVTLNDDSILVGLTKHSPILNGIFMYPNSVIEMDEWSFIKKQAADKNTGIAIFKPIYTVPCLRVDQKSDSKSVKYLVDHRAISRVEWLWRSSSMDTDSSLVSSLNNIPSR